MKDWKGNNIQIGDTIVLVSTRSHGVSSSLVLMSFCSNEPPTVLSTYKEDANYRWLILSTYEIINHNGKLYYSWSNEDYTYNFDLNSIELMKEENVVICIKGKSDNEKEYYEYYFNHE